MGFLESAKRAAKEFFSDYDPNARFLARLMVYTHQVTYRQDGEEPLHYVNCVFNNPDMAKKYGQHVWIESKKLYMSTHTGDELTLWLEVNPDYDGKHPETRLRLADKPH